MVVSAYRGGSSTRCPLSDHPVVRPPRCPTNPLSDHPTGGTIYERKATIASRVGLHARPAAIFAAAARKVPTDVTIAMDGQPADDAMDASSILSVMSLGAAYGDVVVLRAEGEGPRLAALDQPGNGITIISPRRH